VQGDARRMSDNDVLTIDGDVGDHVRLSAIPTGDILEGNWVCRAGGDLRGRPLRALRAGRFDGPGAGRRRRRDQPVPSSGRRA
jgi:hypothetical protein